MNEIQEKKDYKTGLYFVLTCQTIWGILPIYWKALQPIHPYLVILYRIVTMLICCIIIAKIQYSFKEIFAPLKDIKLVLKHLASGFFLAGNWSVFLWAVNTGRVIQTSIGYFIEPLIICAFGIVLFHEKATKFNIAAMFMAFAAVMLILVHFGQLPGVALFLSITWAIYSAIKKASDQPAILALVYETLFYGIIALGVIIYLEVHGMGALQYHVPVKYGFMMASGLLTCVPVTLFAMGAKKVPLFLIGIFQYISPSMTLVIGIYLFKEPLDSVQLMAFGLIWIGIIIFTFGQFKEWKSK